MLNKYLTNECISFLKNSWHRKSDTKAKDDKGATAAEFQFVELCRLQALTTMPSPEDARGRQKPVPRGIVMKGRAEAALSVALLFLTCVVLIWSLPGHFYVEQGSPERRADCLLRSPGT